MGIKSIGIKKYVRGVPTQGEDFGFRIINNLIIEIIIIPTIKINVYF